MREAMTGGVLSYMTHLMNDARKTLEMRDKRIAELEAALRPFALAARKLKGKFAYLTIIGPAGAIVVPGDFERAADLVPEKR